ncbi:hypothetical protein HZS_2828 [Henneguya salminicola]|nr:hypothetical protein HZS_2828 [Henneguya salminicola]
MLQPILSKHFTARSGSFNQMRVNVLCYRFSSGKLLNGRYRLGLKLPLILAMFSIKLSVFSIEGETSRVLSIQPKKKKLFIKTFCLYFFRVFHTDFRILVERQLSSELNQISILKKRRCIQNISPFICFIDLFSEYIHCFVFMSSPPFFSTVGFGFVPNTYFYPTILSLLETSIMIITILTV